MNRLACDHCGADSPQLRETTDNHDAVTCAACFIGSLLHNVQKFAFGTGGQRMSAREIITARLGRDLGPLATMPRDLRNAIYLLALQLQRMKK